MERIIGNHMKHILKRIIIINLLMIILLSTENCCFSEINQLKVNSILINVINNVNVGNLINGRTKTNFYNNQYIKFEIICSKSGMIKITDNSNLNNKYCKVGAEWKCGQVTGFESDFINNFIYTPLNGKFYITIKVISIEVAPNSKKGKYNFTPSIVVEYIK
jgi:hypothetical protein